MHFTKIYFWASKRTWRYLTFPNTDKPSAICVGQKSGPFIAILIARVVAKFCTVAWYYELPVTLPCWERTPQPTLPSTLSKGSTSAKHFRGVSKPLGLCLQENHAEGKWQFCCGIFTKGNYIQNAKLSSLSHPLGIFRLYWWQSLCVNYIQSDSLHTKSPTKKSQHEQR